MSDRQKASRHFIKINPHNIMGWFETQNGNEGKLSMIHIKLLRQTISGKHCQHYCINIDNIDWPANFLSVDKTTLSLPLMLNILIL